MLLQPTLTISQVGWLSIETEPNTTKTGPTGSAAPSPSRDGVSLVVPAYNEEQGVGPTIEDFLPYVDEIVVVDDGSRDRTAEIVKKYPVKLLRHQKNLGKVAAIRTGVKAATHSFVVLTDADHTYPGCYVPEMVKALGAGADLVLGSRVGKGFSNVPWLNRIGNVLFSFLVTYFGGVEVSDAQTGYRAFPRKLFKEFDVSASGLEFETMMTLQAAKRGYHIVEIPVEYRPRVGRSKLRPLRDGLKMFLGLARVAYKETSLLAKTVIIPGFLLVVVGFLVGLVSLWEKLSRGVLIHEYYPLVTVLTILVGLQLSSLGLILDCLSRRLSRLEAVTKKPGA
ncbi:MAG: glycosyltransferase family 2 protein [Methanobacteriota archaeon]|nr:MAG: glycosyltransferase family 2 protein [Euryarchaeota archaeon]